VELFFVAENTPKNGVFVIFRTIQPPKTTLEAKNHEKTLTVHEALFRRESVPLSMHGRMESMAIKHDSF
jgi:hypothetical protein